MENFHISCSTKVEFVPTPLEAHIRRETVLDDAAMSLDHRENLISCFYKHTNNSISRSTSIDFRVKHFDSLGLGSCVTLDSEDKFIEASRSSKIVWLVFDEYNENTLSQVINVASDLHMKFALF